MIKLRFVAATILQKIQERLDDYVYSLLNPLVAISEDQDIDTLLSWVKACPPGLVRSDLKVALRKRRLSHKQNHKGGNDGY